MASSKDIPQPSRPPHRLSISNSGSFSGRSHTRNNSSITGSLNPNHRVTRRKSVSQNNTNVAALAAAARDVSGDTSFSMPAQRRGTLSRSFGKSSLHTPPSSLPFSRPTIATKHSLGKHDNAIEDDEIENYEEDEIVGPFDKARQRRASEGQSAKGIGKKAKDDLRCTKCGKGYKHSSCLTKHLWEHTPEWSYTSKLLISKHQQVQLLEAATVLVAMNADGSTPPESMKDPQSDADSASPAASGTSDQRGGLSSADTTPPPHDASDIHSATSYDGNSQGFQRSSTFSRFYQPVRAGSYLNESVPKINGYEHQRRGSQHHRSSGMAASSEDDTGLTTAIELLSCSFGTPRTVPAALSPDVPPVPPLPAQYIGQSAFSETHSFTPQYNRASTSYIRGDSSRAGDVKMEETEGSVMDDEDYDVQSRGRSDEDDDGVFGRMEE